MLYYYTTFEGILQEDEIGQYTTHGIRAVYTSDRATVVSSVSDVSVDYDEAKKIADMCNELELEPVHLLDVVEDMISRDI